jgi:RHS repeat-associated protein
VWQAGHGAFGGAAPVVQQIVQPLRFAGQYHDGETGLHYNRYRYYDPALGRYITRDPMGITQGLNVYCYSGNDPIGRCDPMGLWGWKDTLSVVAGAVVAVAVVLTAPIWMPAAIAGTVVAGAVTVIAAGAAGGAVAMGLNEGLNQEVFCLKCIAMQAGKGALIGAFASLPFIYPPAIAGVPSFLAASGLSGFMGYAGDFALTPGAKWNWGDAARAAAWGLGFGALLRYGPKAIPKRAPKTAASKPVSYKRPTSFRKGVRNEAWENAKGPDGKVRDPVTQKVMKKSDPWDMGHKPGYEFRKHKASAEKRGISRKKFLDEHNEAKKYRPELPSSNRSHKGEIKTDEYFGK